MFVDTFPIDPADSANLLVGSDWLDEQGLAHCEDLRVVAKLLLRRGGVGLGKALAEFPGLAQAFRAQFAAHRAVNFARAAETILFDKGRRYCDGYAMEVTPMTQEDRTAVLAVIHSWRRDMRPGVTVWPIDTFLRRECVGNVGAPLRVTGVKQLERRNASVGPTRLTLELSDGSLIRPAYWAMFLRRHPRAAWHAQAEPSPSRIYRHNPLLLVEGGRVVGACMGIA